MTKSATRAKEKYNSANYDQVKIWVKKEEGGKEWLDQVAADAEMSRNAYILEAIKEKIERDKKTEQED